MLKRATKSKQSSISAQERESQQNIFGIECFLCRAHETYKAAVVKGDDGRPDFMARKSCNYLDDAIEVKHYDDDVDDDDDDIEIYHDVDDVCYSWRVQLS